MTQATNDLLEGLRRGTPAAFNRLYEAERPRVYGFLLRLSGSRSVAEDLLQETFLKLARGASSLRDGSNLRALLFTIARNTFISFVRWRSLDFERLTELSLLPAPPPSESPLEQLARDERQRGLEAALLQLSAADREILLLVGVEGFSPSEAAQIVGASPEAARQRLARARRRLQSELDRPTTRLGAARGAVAAVGATALGSMKGEVKS